MIYWKEQKCHYSSHQIAWSLLKRKVRLIFHKKSEIKIIEDSSEGKNHKLSRNNSSKLFNESKYYKNLDWLAKDLVDKMNKQSKIK